MSSNVPRQVTILVNNATSDNLSCRPTGGSSFKPVTLDAYYSHSFVTESTTGDLLGVLDFCDPSGTVRFTISYKSSATAGDSYWHVAVGEGGIYTVQSDDTGTAAVVGEVSFYYGVSAGGGYAIELAPLSKVSFQQSCAETLYGDFTEQMFAPGVRDVMTAVSTVNVPAHVKESSAQYFYADMTGGQIPTIVGLLTDCWMRGDTTCAIADQRLIAFFKDFLSYQGFPECDGQSAPRLYVPVLTSLGVYPDGDTSSTLPKYELVDYYRIKLTDEHGDWVQSAVEVFLTLVVTGAHVVTMRYVRDGIAAKFGKAMDFRKLLKENLGHRGDLGNSHYTSTVNTSGYYYLTNIDGETMPAKVDDGSESACPGFLNAFMTALTNSAAAFSGDMYNCFFQLEGWPAHGLTGGTRHMQDYDASTATYWNVSTFGASPYSEKRGATVFLAPPGWKPTPTEITLMMPYYGAWANHNLTPQSWLQTDLVEINDGTAAPYNGDHTQ